MTDVDLNDLKIQRQPVAKRNRFPFLALLLVFAVGAVIGFYANRYGPLKQEVEEGGTAPAEAAVVAAELKERILARTRELLGSGAVSAEDLDRDEAAFRRAAAMRDAKAQDLALKEEGSRVEEIDAAEAEHRRRLVQLEFARNEQEREKLLFCREFEGLAEHEEIEMIEECEEPEFPCDEGLERRIAHINVAVENLHAAGMHAEAEDFLRHAAELERELMEKLEPRSEHGMPAHLEQLTNEMHALRTEVRELRAVVFELRDRIGRLAADRN